MAAVARGGGVDQVFSRTGGGFQCLYPFLTGTGTCSTTVFANGIGVVRLGDTVGPHPIPYCSGIDVSVVSVASTTVFANGRGVARIGDEYTLDNIIISGSHSVFIGG